jgi:glycosyltransferase involved in cell wall biosynthesis
MGLIQSLWIQTDGKPVELLYLGDNKRMSVGEKRNWLLRMSKGEYVCFVDDDDRVSPHYVQRILEATESRPDCVVFDVQISENGGTGKQVTYNKDFIQDTNYFDRYERMPNHLMPIKRDIACSAGFPEKSSGEDFEYAKRICSALKTQVRIPETLYYYDYNVNLSETPR